MVRFRARDAAQGMYLLFRFDSLHIFHLGISKILKECIVAYLSSEMVMAHTANARREGKLFYR